MTVPLKPFSRLDRRRHPPVLIRLQKNVFPDEPYRGRPAVLAPGGSFADTLHLLTCAGPFREFQGSLCLSGPFLVGNPGETNERATVVVEHAVEVDIPMP